MLNMKTNKFSKQEDKNTQKQKYAQSNPNMQTFERLWMGTELNWHAILNTVIEARRKQC